MISREHKLRKGAYSVLIVCEGQNTEPSYFSKFQNYLNEKYKSEYPDGIYFSIFPYPQEEKEIIDLENQLFTRVKQKQEIQNFAAIINEDVEDEFLAEPTRWVRFAQKNSVNAGFNELWSVFDYDNRPVAEIKKAFDLARNTELENGNVKIAYSSYSFEYWLLLHYELFDTYIAGSECKDKNGKEIGCSRKGCTNSNNCNGTKCLGGYMRSKSYEVSNYNKTTE
jgi:hypothetical protein